MKKRVYFELSIVYIDNQSFLNIDNSVYTRLNWVYNAGKQLGKLGLTATRDVMGCDL